MTEALLRRSTDGRGFRIGIAIERGVIWASFVALVAVISFYLRVKDIVENSPGQKEDIQALKTWRAVADERWVRVEKFMDRIEKKLDHRRER